MKSNFILPVLFLVWGGFFFFFNSYSLCFFKPYFTFLFHPVIFQTFSSLFVILLSFTEIAFSCTLWRKAKRFLKFFKTLWRLFSSSSFIPYLIDPYFSSASHSSVRSAHTFCQQTEVWTVLVPLCMFVRRWSSLLKSTIWEQVKILLVHFPVFRVFSIVIYLWHLTPCTSKLWNHWKVNILTRYL